MSDTSSHQRREFFTTSEGSTGSNRFVPAPLPPGSAPPVRNDQPTVISQRTPVPAPFYGSPSNPAELGRTLLGQKLDHFELLEYVGGGGMGAVFKALDTRLNRIVALKVLARDQADEEEKVRRFQNEAQSAARLDHDHIARVYFVGQDCGLHYIVFEYIEGINLRELVERKGPLPLDEAISFTLQVAEALAHASSRDVVHRDIKPSNLLITPQGRAKLVDMGLARLHQVEHSQNDLTSSGVTLGTFDYISPEQARDPRSADVRSDIYSLGCTLYFMLTGRPPFPEGNVLQKLLQHNNDPPPDPAEYYPELPEVVSRLVRKMLAKDPRKRHQTAGELVAELLAIFDQLGLSVPGIDTMGWTTPKPARFGGYERHLPWVAPIVLLLVIVLALDLWSSHAEMPELDAAARDDQAELARFRAGRVGTQADQPGNEANGAAEQTESASDAATVSTAPFNVAQGATNGGVSTGATLNPASMSPNPAMLSAMESRLSDATAAGVHMPPSSASISVEGGAGVDPGDESAGVGYTATADAAAATSTAVTSTVAVQPTAPRPGVLVVTPNAKAAHEHATLQKACAVAKEKGIDVIELQFNGPLEEKPLRLNNQKLTIRAAENYQPVIVFRPKEIAISDWQPMISIVGGQLTLVNVAIEFDVARNLQPQGWALFETQRPELLRLEHCSLTIRNANEQRMAMHPDVAFFDIKAPPGNSFMEMSGTVAADPAVAIRLEKCIARGEATLLRTLQSQPVTLSWTNGLLATSERLLRAAGGDMPPRQGGIISIDLRHVTAVVRDGLCHMSNAEGGGPLLHTEVKCADSILLSGGTVPLVEQFGVNSPAEFEDQFYWSGTRYFHSGVDVFWRISSLATLGSSHPPVERRFDQWQAYWGETAEDNAMWSQIEWAHLPESRPFHTHSAADYALAEASESNRARGGASDGLDAGFQAEELPPLPVALPADSTQGTSSAAPTP